MKIDVKEQYYFMILFYLPVVKSTVFPNRLELVASTFIIIKIYHGIATIYLASLRAVFMQVRKRGITTCPALNNSHNGV